MVEGLPPGRQLKATRCRCSAWAPRGGVPSAAHRVQHAVVGGWVVGQAAQQVCHLLVQHLRRAGRRRQTGAGRRCSCCKPAQRAEKTSPASASAGAKVAQAPPAHLGRQQLRAQDLLGGGPLRGVARHQPADDLADHGMLGLKLRGDELPLPQVPAGRGEGREVRPARGTTAAEGSTRCCRGRGAPEEHRALHGGAEGVPELEAHYAQREQVHFLIIGGPAVGNLRAAGKTAGQGPVRACGETSGAGLARPLRHTRRGQWTARLM